MPRYLLTGDITHGGRVSVVGKDLEDAITNAEIGDFDEVYDEDHKNLGFAFCGDEEGGVDILDPDEGNEE